MKRQKTMIQGAKEKSENFNFFSVYIDSLPHVTATAAKNIESNQLSSDTENTSVSSPIDINQSISNNINGVATPTQTPYSTVSLKFFQDTVQTKAVKPAVNNIKRQFIT